MFISEHLPLGYHDMVKFRLYGGDRFENELRGRGLMFDSKKSEKALTAIPIFCTHPEGEIIPRAICFKQIRKIDQIYQAIIKFIEMIYGIDMALI